MKRTKDNKPEMDSTKRALLLEAFSSTGYFVLNKNLIKIFGLQLAVYITNLMDKLQYFMQNDILEEDGSFFLTIDDQEEHTGLSTRQIRSCKSKLKELDILHTELRGAPPKEFYLIDFNKLEKVIANSNPDNSLVLRVTKCKGKRLKNCTNIKENKYKEIRYNDYKKEKNTKKKKSKNDQFLPLARKLSETIQSTKNISHTTQQLKKWADEIRKLSELQQVSYQRIDKALNWYSENIGGEFIPVIESGSALRNKFVKLENAIERQNLGYSDKTKGGGGKNAQKGLKCRFSEIFPENKIGADLRKQFQKEILPCAKATFDFESNSKLTHALLDFYLEVKSERDKHRPLPEKILQMLPSPMEIVHNYIKWIGSQDWIDLAGLHLLKTHCKLFKDWRNKMAGCYNFGDMKHDPVSGIGS